MLKLLLVCAAGAGLVACAPQPENLAGRGYVFHDANHPNPVSSSDPTANPTASAKGTWLWPPAANDVPD